MLFKTGFFIVFCSISSGKAVLSPGFIDGNRNAVGKVQAPVVRSHRQAYAMAFLKKSMHFLGQSFGFRTENEHVTRPEFQCGKYRTSVGRESEHAGWIGRHFFQKVIPVFIDFHPCKLMVIQSARRILASSNGKPRGSIRWSCAPELAHNRMILPVLGGISVLPVRHETI